MHMTCRLWIATKRASWLSATHRQMWYCVAECMPADAFEQWQSIFCHLLHSWMVLFLWLCCLKYGFNLLGWFAGCFYGCVKQVKMQALRLRNHQSLHRLATKMAALWCASPLVQRYRLTSVVSLQHQICSRPWCLCLLNSWFLMSRMNDSVIYCHLLHVSQMGLFFDCVPHRWLLEILNILFGPLRHERFNEYHLLIVLNGWKCRCTTWMLKLHYDYFTCHSQRYLN